MSGITTVSVNPDTAATLREIRDEHDFNNINEVVVWLIDGGEPEISYADKTTNSEVDLSEVLGRIDDLENTLPKKVEEQLR